MFNFIYRKSIFRNLAQSFTVEHDDFAAAQSNQVACSKFFECSGNCNELKAKSKKPQAITLTTYQDKAGEPPFA
jgi:hypothetical protein